MGVGLPLPRRRLSPVVCRRFWRESARARFPLQRAIQPTPSPPSRGAAAAADQAHWPLWGRPELLARSDAFFLDQLQNATAYAAFEGYTGAHWPKETAAVVNRRWGGADLAALTAHLQLLLPTAPPLQRHRRAVAGQRDDAVAIWRRAQRDAARVGVAAGACLPAAGCWSGP